MSIKSLREQHLAVLDQLRWEPDLDESRIALAVGGGVVTLTGTVASYGEKLAAETAVLRVPGMHAVANDIEVRPPGETRSDTDLARSALVAIRWMALVDDDRVRLSVSRGWVTLEGCVDSDDQRRTAGEAVMRLFGVIGITNLITVALVPVATG